MAFAILFTSVTAIAQTVTADEIMNKAKNGDNVRYENVTVSGIVDLTPYPEEGRDLPSRKWFSTGDNMIDNTIRGEITFVNVTFEDDFLAYYHDERSEYTFVSHFDEAVTFKNCTFLRDAAFKYSEFEEEADFSGSTFNRDANFKYAEYQREANYSNTRFDEEGNFKYAEFKEQADFSNAVFDEDANFKYAELRDGVKFTNAEFNGLWNIKYADMDDEVDLSGIQVNDDVDSKYTKINGRSFERYLLSNRDR